MNPQQTDIIAFCVIQVTLLVANIFIAIRLLGWHMFRSMHWSLKWIVLGLNALMFLQAVTSAVMVWLVFDSEVERQQV